MRNLATSLALHGKLTTTTAKAKALVSYYEQMITRAKRGNDVNAIRTVQQYLFTQEAQKAFVAKLKDLTKQSGYLRTTKVGLRAGDRAEMSLVEFVG